MNTKCASCKNFWGSSEEMKWDGYSIICKYCPDFEKESGLMIYRGDNYHHCLECKCVINFGDTVTQGKWGYYCGQCSERENMPNIKITAEVDGKQVPLETVSTETFEAIKALEKPKEIPVARLADYSLDSKPRLLFRPTKNISLKIGRVYGLDLKCGIVRNDWHVEEDEHTVRNTYTNVRPL